MTEKYEGDKVDLSMPMERAVPRDEGDDVDYRTLGGPTSRLDEPKTALMQAWWRLVEPFVREARARGWAMTAEVVYTDDERTVGVLAVEFGSGVLPTAAAVTTALPLVPHGLVSHGEPARTTR